MAIKMNDTDRAICLDYAPEQRQRDGMVTTQCDHPWQCLPILCGALLLSVRRRLTA